CATLNTYRRGATLERPSWPSRPPTLKLRFRDAGAFAGASFFKSRPAHSVKPIGIICPLWIEKIGRREGKCVRLQRGPDGMSQVCGGLDGNGHAVAASDVKTELIGANPKTCIGDLNLHRDG